MTAIQPRTRPVIDPEFAALLPPATQEVIGRLEMKLSVEGFRDPLVVWKETGILLDGHTRLKLCDKYRIEYAVEYLSFPDRDAAKQWVIDNQLGRRNLTDERRAYYIGLDYLHRKQAHGGQVPGGSAHNAHSLESAGRTAEKIAEKHGIDGSTVRRNAQFAQAVDAIGSADPAAKEAILSGTSGRTKAEVVRSTPALCDGCRRAGAVDDCPRCAGAGGAKPAPRAPQTPPEPSVLAELKAATTGLARKYTEAIRGKGEAGTRLLRYLSAAGLVDHTPGTIKEDEIRDPTARFLPFAGVRALVELAEAPGPPRSDAEVRRIYDRASGGWIPPITRRRRAQRRGRGAAGGGTT